MGQISRQLTWDIERGLRRWAFPWEGSISSTPKCSRDLKLLWTSVEQRSNRACRPRFAGPFWLSSVRWLNSKRAGEITPTRRRWFLLTVSEADLGTRLRLRPQTCKLRPVRERCESVSRGMGRIYNGRACSSHRPIACWDARISGSRKRLSWLTPTSCTPHGSLFFTQNSSDRIHLSMSTPTSLCEQCTPPSTMTRHCTRPRARLV